MNDPYNDHEADNDGDAYAGALDHYTSPVRRDWVKREWEEPQLIALLDRAVRRTSPAEGSPIGPTPPPSALQSPASAVQADPLNQPGPALRCLDVGCGTGVVLELLRATEALTAPDAPDAPELHYLGVDLDPDLLRVAEQRLGSPLARFVEGDIRDTIPEAPHDLYLSSGVPYSHLTREELSAVVTEALAAGRDRAATTVLVVDVLGRYSIEWTTRWEHTRWPYRMSFFATDREVGTPQMSTYGGEELTTLLRAAAREAGRTLAGLELVDRSIVVGRHTATGAYTPGLPDYRQLVNELADPTTLVDLGPLRLGPLQRPAAPAPVQAFFDRFASRWDARLADAERSAATLSEERVAEELQPQLARDLRALEQHEQPGLGVGHSLTALVVAAPDA